MGSLNDEMIDDIMKGDGYHNVQPPEDWVDNPVPLDTKELQGIVLTADGIPYRHDIINISLTPEELVIVTQVLEHFSCFATNTLDYVDELDMDMYDQQGYVRKLRDRFSDRLDYYVKERPYTPFLPQWVKRIGKEDVRKV